MAFSAAQFVVTDVVSCANLPHLDKVYVNLVIQQQNSPFACDSIPSSVFRLRSKKNLKGRGGISFNTSYDKGGM